MRAEPVAPCSASWPIHGGSLLARAAMTYLPRPTPCPHRRVRRSPRSTSSSRRGLLDATRWGGGYRPARDARRSSIGTAGGLRSRLTATSPSAGDDAGRRRRAGLARRDPEFAQVAALACARRVTSVCTGLAAAAARPTAPPPTGRLRRARRPLPRITVELETDLRAQRALRRMASQRAWTSPARWSRRTRRELTPAAPAASSCSCAPGGSPTPAQLAAQPAERQLSELDLIPENLDEDRRSCARRRAFMSERNFARARLRETGMTPAAHVEAARSSVPHRARSPLVSRRSPRCGWPVDYVPVFPAWARPADYRNFRPASREPGRLKPQQTNTFPPQGPEPWTSQSRSMTE
jgi:hypothetical protein